MGEENTVVKPPEVLYHYCSVPTFYNIIKNKTIWLSDISKSNDSEELRWFMRFYEGALAATWDSYVKNRAEKGKQDDSDLLQNEFKGIIEDLHSERAKCWAFCLSEKRDDLGQWRGYADNGSGVAIGFRSSVFCSLSLLWTGLKEQRDKNLFNPKFDRVNYGKESLENLFKKIPEVLAETLVTEAPYEAAEKLKKGIVNMYRFAPFYKNAGFQEEREWRIIYSLSTNDMMIGKKPDWPYYIDSFLCAFHLSDWGYVEKNGNLVSHVEFTNPHLNEAISEIIIGPKCKLTETEVKLFLIASGLISHADIFEIKISKSASSYR